ncbi:non-hydrolyzing UDP-N-acetylglucosamine 2-epimerase [Parapedobacter lycopersici]|uniref:non-hydrolyzing UDP-N-acetylglucosamine 2-epimerase n=1 Tax=Parapedobacter lycopersici TaxID=1864939 RepID=UPI00214DD4AF|nr:UDP-N-acetylglucosamine 2-epimerase (non-hydrolyzing) [Parapedobacter lycopersici]
MKKILIVFGTRPEAVKMAPVVKALQRYPDRIDLKVCVTAQHREMLDQVLRFFELVPDFDLDLMRHNQDLYELTSDILLGLKGVLQQFAPDMVLVHGDTTTSSVTALAAYYAKIPVAHVEAGLRTYDLYAPFPEEVNRQLTGRIANLHFAPTDFAKHNLLNEHVPESAIHVTGNTVIDALYWARERLNRYSDEEIRALQSTVNLQKKLILVTAHRRENQGEGMANICNALREIASRNEVEVAFPVHLNPSVRGPVYDRLSGVPNIKLLPPLGYPAFTWLMIQSYIIITDSGGIQEEAPGLGKPVLVMRNVTERPEAVDAGVVKLVGTDKARIIQETERLIQDPAVYAIMSQAANPYGDGKSALRIAETLLNSGQ